MYGIGARILTGARIGPGPVCMAPQCRGPRFCGPGPARQSEVAPRRHLLFIPVGPVAEELDRYRTRFDPVMASRSPAHVTLVYPEEYDDEPLLLERIGNAVVDRKTFPVVVKGFNHNPATGGVWFSVEDPTGGWWHLRSAVLAPPFGSRGARPHLTVVHPRTSSRGGEAVEALEGGHLGGEIQLGEVLYAETSSHGLRIVDRFPLAGGEAEKVVVGMLRDGDRLLLGHRHPDRASFPNVWDLPGGHVDEGETLWEALRREMDEELGIRVERATDLASLRLGLFDLTFFVVDEWRGVPRNTAPDEHDELRWVSIENLHHLRFPHTVYLSLLRRAGSA